MGLGVAGILSTHCSSFISASPLDCLEDIHFEVQPLPLEFLISLVDRFYL